MDEVPASDGFGIAQAHQLLAQLRRYDSGCNDFDYGVVLEELRTFALEKPDDWLLVGGERTILKLIDRWDL